MFENRFKKELDPNLNLEIFDVNSLNIQDVKNYVIFIHKSLMTPSYYDYRTYYSVKDYCSQNCSPTYLFSKSNSEGYILDLIG